jgi:hypothetical protein
MENQENETLLKLGRLQIESFERIERKEERLAQLKKSLPADQWRRLLSLAEAYDAAADAYYRVDGVADDDAIGEAANCVENAMMVLSQAGEDIYPEFYDDYEDLVSLAKKEAGLEWARAVVAEEQQTATATA